MGTVLLVPQLDHELVACFCVLRQAEPFLPRATGEAVGGKGWVDDVKGGVVFAAGGEVGEDFGYFDEATRP